MLLDQSVFGYDYFKVTDSLAFPGPGPATKYVKIEGTSQTRGQNIAGRGTLLEVVYTFTVCHRFFRDKYEGQVHGCYPGQPDCNEYDEITECDNLSWTEYEYDEGGGGGGNGGGGGGGGGGDGGGAWTLPPCPGGGVSRGATYDLCTPGVEPVFYPPQTNPCDIVKPLRSDNVFISNFTDLRTKTNLAYESGYVLDENGIFTLHQGSPNAQEINWTATGMVTSYIHNHLTGDLRIFSVGDLLLIYTLVTTSHAIPSTFTMGVTVPSGDSYVMVIDNVAKFLSFGSQYFEADGKFDRGDLERLYMGAFKVDKASSAQEAETNFLQFMQHLDAGLTVMKADNTFSNYQKLALNRSNQAYPQSPCPPL